MSNDGAVGALPPFKVFSIDSTNGISAPTPVQHCATVFSEVVRALRGNADVLR